MSIRRRNDRNRVLGFAAFNLDEVLRSFKWQQEAPTTEPLVANL